MKIHLASLVLYSMALFTSAAAEPYSAPPVMLKTSEILPKEWRSGTNFTVKEGVLNDGLFNTYQLDTDDGPLTVESTVLLVKRINELRVMEQIGTLKKTDTFTTALKSAGKAPFQAVENLIDEPVNTVKSIGTGVGRWFKDVGRSITSEDPHQPNVLDTAIGQAPVRRQFAYEFGVDPYTSYAPLDKELNEVAWAAAGGGLTVKAAFGAVGGSVGSALSLGGTAQGMRAMVRDKSPAELNTLIEAQLADIGVPASLGKRFLANQAFNPQERTLFVGELVNLKNVENRRVLVAGAASAPSESVALYMRVRAQLMGQYAQEEKIIRFVEAGSVPLVETKDGNVVGIFPLDHVLWTPSLEQRLEAMEKDLNQVQGTKDRILLILGTVDSAAREAMTARNWKVLDSQFQRLREL